MLGQRVITALLLLPIVLGPILFLDTGWVYLVFSLIGLLGAWEWTALMGLAAKPARIGYVLLVAAALAASWFAAAQGLGLWILLAGVLWWLRAIDLVRHGHAMSIPVPGVRGHAALAALRPEHARSGAAGGRVAFAHADLSAYSVFEEAFHHGDAAGRLAASRLRARG